jgi:catechol 2,3-dioxygenase-like lactoylglutathione lyase family enzyme
VSTEVLSLPVSDQSRARDFYVDVLGFELLRDAQMQPGMGWVQVAPRDGGATIALRLSSSWPVRRSG